ERLESIDTLVARDDIIAAIVVGPTGPNQLHLGILHGQAHNPPECLHLRFHCLLENATEPKYFTYGVVPGYPTIRLDQVAALCRLIWTSNGRYIPYGFSRPDNAIQG